MLTVPKGFRRGIVSFLFRNTSNPEPTLYIAGQAGRQCHLRRSPALCGQPLPIFFAQGVKCGASNLAPAAAFCSLPCSSPGLLVTALHPSWTCKFPYLQSNLACTPSEFQLIDPLHMVQSHRGYRTSPELGGSHGRRYHYCAAKEIFILLAPPVGRVCTEHRLRDELQQTVSCHQHLHSRSCALRVRLQHGVLPGM